MKVTDVQRDLMTVHVTLEGKDVTVAIHDLVSSASGSDIAGVNDAILQHAQDFAWLSTLEALAIIAVEDAKDVLGALEADFLGGIDKDEAVTRAKARMRSVPGWVTLRDALRRAEKQLAMIRVGRKTCEEHKSALSEVARNLRAEMERLLTVRAPVAVADAERRMQERYGRKT